MKIKNTTVNTTLAIFLDIPNSSLNIDLITEANIGKSTMITKSMMWVGVSTDLLYGVYQNLSNRVGRIVPDPLYYS